MTVGLNLEMVFDSLVSPNSLMPHRIGTTEHDLIAIQISLHIEDELLGLFRI